ncbi:MAG TPA: hypothetical protein QGF58_05060 [Myxococcota bacterium]|nr:hypothetical protein [Myxococcota bacterium]
MVGIPHFDPRPHLGPPAIPTTVKIVGFAMLAVGLAALAGMLQGGEESALRARIAFLVSMNYFVGISFGGIAFLAAMTITEARWSRPLKRIAEGFAAFTPVIWILFLLFYATGGLDLYEWHNHPEQFHGHKHAWLQDGFFLGRNLFAMGLLSLLGLLYIRASLKPDLLAAKAELGSVAPAWWDRVIGGATNVNAEIESANKHMTVLSPILAILYAVTLTLYAFDAIMSLAPHWYANMFGGWFFASCFWLTMIALGLFSLAMRGWMGIKHLLKPGMYHDLGQLIFAFCIIWTYMFFAQLLPIWYGNMTEEIGFLLVRMTLEPWNDLAKVVGCMCFLIPFGTLLSRGIKKMPLGFAIVLAVPAIGIALERFLVAAPSVWMGDTIPLGPGEVAIFAGFLGAFVLVVSKYVSSVPPVPVTDPYMLPHPNDIHVHSRDAAHH